MSLGEKQEKLQRCLASLESVLVAYSGGVDSAVLAWSAHRALGDRMLAVLADSPSLARAHFRDAVAFAEEHGMPLEVIRTAEMDNPEYIKNDTLRCYHCKNELFQQMETANQRLGFRHLAYGMNVDDRVDFRPGQKAAAQHSVVAPLVEAGLTKAEIRTLAQQAGLRVWDKPASACLSSRIAHGNPVTTAVLDRIEQAEAHLASLGFRQLRVRDHAGLARIEIGRDEMSAALAPEFLVGVSEKFRALGFTYVTLDCQGFRSGSMNPARPPAAAA